MQSIKKYKTLSYAELKEELDFYIENKDVKYAILVSGEWGCGKTYVLKEKYLNEKNIFDKKPIYISLNGLSCISEVKNKILIESLGDSVLGKIKPLVGLGSLFIEKQTNGKIKNTESIYYLFLEKFQKINNIIILFDDLERCKIDITEILGFINELVEHNKVKAILIADENKINKTNYYDNLELKYLVVANENLDINKNGDNETSQEQKLFSKKQLKERADNLFAIDNFDIIKEKTIYKTLHYNSNFDETFDNFVNQTFFKDFHEVNTNKILKKVCMDNKEWLNRIFEEYEHRNLRTLQYVLDTFKRIGIIVAESTYNELLMNELFKYIALKTIWIKKGVKTYNWENGQKFGSICMDEDDKNYESYTMGFRFIDDYILSSYLNRDCIIDTINEYLVTTNVFSNDSDLQIIEGYWEYSENEINIAIGNIKNKIIENKYNLNIYWRIINRLSCIELIDIAVTDIHEIINAMKQNIKDGKVNGNFTDDYAYEISDVEQQKKYKKYIDEIEILVKEGNKEKVINELNEILSKKEWGYLLKDYCYKNELFFENECSFFKYIDTKTVINNIISKSIKEITDFRFVIKRVYKSYKMKKYIILDKVSIEKFCKNLEKQKVLDKMRKYNIALLIKDLKDIINYMDDIIKNER